MSATEPSAPEPLVTEPTSLDRRLAPVMFAVTTTYIVALGMVLHLVAGEASEPYAPWVWGAVAVLAGLTELYLVEALLHARAGSPRWKRDLLCCLFPPARLAVRDHAGGTSVWLPGLGWRHADDKLADAVQKKVSLPMIGVALLVVPLLAIELYFSDRGMTLKGWDFGMKLASAAMWTVFTMEFVVMITVVESKIAYIKKHWLDLVIILLPLFEFLRALRIGRLLRLNQATKLGRVGKVFRIRGGLMRSWRAILVLGVIQRLLRRTPQRRLAELETQIREREAELAELRLQLASVERELAEQNRLVAA